MTQHSDPSRGAVPHAVRVAGSRRPSGQTLVEISILVTVLMILAGTLLPVIADSVSSARVARARHDASRIAAELVSFERDHGQAISSLASEFPMPNVTDPWGHQFLLNVVVLRAARPDAHAREQYAVFVISAGPNGVIETPFVQPASSARAYGDDVIVRIQ